MYENYDNAGNRIIATTRSGKNIIGGRKDSSKVQTESSTSKPTEDVSIDELKREVEELQKWKAEEITKDKIIVVGSVDGSGNIPVLANGKRRTIASS